MAGHINPLVVIVGETASGKSDLAIELAKQLNGEIICADSRTVYRGMDIGTAKPSSGDRLRVRHHCLDIVTPGEPFTAADFKMRAQEAIGDVAARDKLPILVGGTGLYIDAVLYDYEFRAPAGPELRAELGALSVDDLRTRLIEQGIALPNNPQNPRHLVRALETHGQLPQRNPLRGNTLIIGMKVEREELRRRITARVDAMIQAGLEGEVRSLAVRHVWNISPMQTIGYQEWQGYFAGVQSMEQTRALIIKNTMQYAKRQRTWFKRNNSVHWITNREELDNAVDLITTTLNK